MADRHVLCAGSVNWDVVVHADGLPDPESSARVRTHRTGCGGSAANTALALASLGADAAVTAAVGADDRGDRVAATLRDHGVRTHLGRYDGRTSLVYAFVPGDGGARYLTHDYPPPALPPWPVDADADHLHTADFDRDRAADFAERAAEAGWTVSFNPSLEYAETPQPRLVAAADVVFLNEREAAIFRDRHDFDAVTRETVVVLTRGPDGSTAYAPDGRVKRPAFDVATGDGDAVGAGDAFVAGFLDAWLSDPDDLGAALVAGNAAGAHAVTRVGAPDALDAEYVAALRSGRPA